MSNGQDQGSGGGPSAADRQDAKDKAGTGLIIIGIGVEIIGTIGWGFGLVPFGPFACVLGAVVIIVGLVVELVDVQKACEAEIVESGCRQGWLQVGQHVCVPCKKDQQECPHDQEEFEMYDLPVNTPAAKPTDRKCTIKVKYVGKKCTTHCDHPTIVPLPVEGQ